MKEPGLSHTRRYPPIRRATDWGITTGVLLFAAATAAAAGQRTALFCRADKLDLSCPSFTVYPQTKAPLVGFEPLDARYANQAYVVRWGEGQKKNAEPRWTIQLGNTIRQALFWAAVASVLL